ncbi:MAG: hypothetical protein WD794_03755 [Mycobacteriales bacterium]
MPVPVPTQARLAPPDAGSLLAAADADADAVADRLHDGALQALLVARYAADAAVRGADPALAREAVQDALVTLRRAVWQLRPRGGEDLPVALADLSAQRAQAGAPPLDLALDSSVAAALPPAARRAAYRFVQAAAPAAGPAAVRLTHEGDCARLSVTGIPADVAGWTARAAALDGRFEVCGATSRLVLPLTRSEPEGDR